MLFVVMVLCCITSSATFRGPHHPESSVHHKHAKPGKDSSFLKDSQIIHDIEHLKEDLGGMAEDMDFSKMTAEEMDFYYFERHDLDKNNKLDGLEMLHAFQHIYGEESENKEYAENPENFIDIINSALSRHDKNKDGFLEWVEFRQSRGEGNL